MAELTDPTAVLLSIFNERLSRVEAALRSEAQYHNERVQQNGRDSFSRIYLDHVDRMNSLGFGPTTAPCSAPVPTTEPDVAIMTDAEIDAALREHGINPACVTEAFRTHILPLLREHGLIKPSPAPAPDAEPCVDCLVERRRECECAIRSAAVRTIANPDRIAELQSRGKFFQPSPAPAAGQKIRAEPRPGLNWAVVRNGQEYTAAGTWAPDRCGLWLGVEADARALAADLERRERGEG